jgi:hypothetical protein
VWAEHLSNEVKRKFYKNWCVHIRWPSSSPAYFLIDQLSYMRLVPSRLAHERGLYSGIFGHLGKHVF